MVIVFHKPTLRNWIIHPYCFPDTDQQPYVIELLIHCTVYSPDAFVGHRTDIPSIPCKLRQLQYTLPAACRRQWTRRRRSASMRVPNEPRNEMDRKKEFHGMGLY